jgi:hypothetical protein
MDKPGFHGHTRAKKTGALIETADATMLHERALLANFRVCTLVNAALPLTLIPLNSPILRVRRQAKIIIFARILLFVLISLRKRQLLMPFPGLFLHS